MSFHFDLLQEPWIPVINQEDRLEKVGILDALERAHLLQGISDVSPLVEYGLCRLLCVFLMDALRPEDIEDIEDLLDAGQFDMQAIRDYTSRCIAEGTSFDLFDEKRPFLQVPYDSKYDEGKKTTSARMDICVPSGNNHIHFVHMNKDYVLKYEEAARLLPVCYLFITAGAQGYPSGVNGAPPYFTVIKGENLFQTLANLLMPLAEIQNFEEPPVFWRCQNEVEPKKKIPQTSWLYGMLFPSRRICLIPEDDGIREIYFSQGMNFCELGNWTDPHVTYRVGKDGRFPWRPNGAKAVWRNLNDLIDIKGERAPQVLEIYYRIHATEKKRAHISLYGVQTSNASFLDVFRHELQIPSALLLEGRALIIGDCIGEAEGLASVLKKSISIKGITSAIVQETVQAFYQGCEGALWELCGEDMSQENINEELILCKWKLKLFDIGKQTLSQFLDKVSLTGKEWLELFRQLNLCDKNLVKLKREGEMNDGG